MKRIQLKARLRSGSGKKSAHALRKAEEIPAVLYGHKKDAVSLAIPEHDFWQILHHATTEHLILELAVDGMSMDDALVLVRDVQHHPVTGDVVHIDFQRISLQEQIKVGIPVTLNGVPRGVKEFGGILDHSVREVAVNTTPAQIPESVEIDVSELLIGQSVHVSDLVALYPGIEFVDDAQMTIAHVSPPKKLEVAAEGAEGAEGEAAAAEGAEEGEGAADAGGEEA